MEINFARHCFGTGLFIIAVQENFRDVLAKSSEANLKRASVADSTYAAQHGKLYFDPDGAASF